MTKSRKKSKPARMLFAIRMRNGHPDDLALRDQLRRVSEKASCADAYIIRQGMSALLTILEYKLASKPGTYGLLDTLNELKSVVPSESQPVTE